MKDTLSIHEAATCCGVSEETIRRRLRADRLPGAFRNGPSGVWRIPSQALVADGFNLGRREHASEDSGERQQLEARLMFHEQVAAERLRQIERLERHVNDLRAVLRRFEVEL
jgi:hypothetical protein